MNKLFCFILIIISVSCDTSKQFDSYQSLTNGVWNLNEPVVFKVNMQNTKTQQNVFLNVRTDSKYAYRNLYVISKLTLPNGAVLKDTLEYEMTDAFGKSLGQGITDVKDNKLFYLENYLFSQKGTYVFEFHQAMRKRGQIKGIDQLKGVTAVGLRIEKIQD